MDIASNRKKSLVIGVDINKENIEIAKKLKIKNSIENIDFIHGDISNQKDLKSYVVILSNILEHIKDRIFFLEDIIRKSGAKSFLIRVPLFERDWQIPLRKELEIYYYSDRDHEIEHSIEKFKSEINLCNLKIKEMHTLWGEIWAHCNYEENQS